MKLLKPKMDNRPNELKEALDKIADERGLTWEARFTGDGTIFVDSSAYNREVVFHGKLKWTGADMHYAVNCDEMIKEAYKSSFTWPDLLDGLITYITFELDRLLEKANAEDMANATAAPIIPEDEVDYSKSIHDYHDLLFATKQFAQKNDIQFSLKSDAHNDTFFRFEKRFEATDDSDPLAIKSKVVSIDIANDKQFEGCENLDDVYNKLKVILKDQYRLDQNDSDAPKRCCCASKNDTCGMPEMVNTDKKAVYEAFRSMFINGAVDKIHADAPCIPYKWIVEFCYKDEFVELCDQASRVVRLFCEYIKAKLNEPEKKEES